MAISPGAAEARAKVGPDANEMNRRNYVRVEISFSKVTVQMSSEAYIFGPYKRHLLCRIM